MRRDLPREPDPSGARQAALPPSQRVRHAFALASVFAFAACSFTDLSSLTGGPLGTDEPPNSQGPDAAPNDDDAGEEAGFATDDGSPWTSSDDASAEDAAPLVDADASPPRDADATSDSGGGDANVVDAAPEPTCIVTPFRSPTVAVNVYRKPGQGIFSGNTPWVSPESAFAEDGAFATDQATSGPSQLLYVSGFGFALDDSMVVRGVDIEVVRAVTDHGFGPGGEIIAGSVRLRLDASNDSSATRTVSGTWPTKFSTVTYGGGTDTWGAALKGAIVNNAEFGVLFGFEASSSQFGAQGRVDAIRVRLHYCE